MAPGPQFVFRNCCDAYERRHAVGLVYTGVVVNCDRQGACTDRSDVHDAVVHELKVYAQSMFPGCAFQLEWLSRDDHWMRPVDEAAREARRGVVTPRPLWLCTFAKKDTQHACAEISR